MYGIVEIAGHQYKVGPGHILDVDKLDVEAGQMIDFDKVLLIGGESTLVGMPTVAGAKISAKVVKHDRARKLLVYKRQVGKWRRSRGHRTHFTCLLVTEIQDGQGKSVKIDADSREAKKYLN